MKTARELALEIIAKRGTPDFAICALRNAEAVARALLSNGEALEQLAIWPLLDAVSAGDGHSWVCHSTTDVELKTVVWCQWCGVHQGEVPDWTDDPQCPAFEAMSHLKQHLTREPAVGEQQLRVREALVSMRVDEPKPVASAPVTREQMFEALDDVFIKWVERCPIVLQRALRQCDVRKLQEALISELPSLLAASAGARGAVVEEIAKRHEAWDRHIGALRDTHADSWVQAHHDRATLLALIGAKQP